MGLESSISLRFPRFGGRKAKFERIQKCHRLKDRFAPFWSGGFVGPDSESSSRLAHGTHGCDKFLPCVGKMTEKQTHCLQHGEIVPLGGQGRKLVVSESSAHCMSITSFTLFQC